MLRDAFTALDVNRDGLITADDLKTAWRNAGQDSGQKRIATWIKERDTTQDRTVTFDEFVASFSALLAPGERGWEKRGDVLAADADDDGARPIAAAIGAIRLSASLPEANAALDCVVDILTRAITSPATPSHWRVVVEKSKEYRVKVGTLYGIAISFTLSRVKIHDFTITM